MTRIGTIASLFEKKPHQWGLRGDPYLWREMREYFARTPIPATADELTALIEAAFESLTGHSITETGNFFIERFSHGGMSSGLIEPQFWKDQVIPILRERLAEK